MFLSAATWRRYGRPRGGGSSFSVGLRVGCQPTRRAARRDSWLLVLLPLAQGDHRHGIRFRIEHDFAFAALELFNDLAFLGIERKFNGTVVGPFPQNKCLN